MWVRDRNTLRLLLAQGKASGANEALRCGISPLSLCACSVWVGIMCHKSWCRVVVPAYFRGVECAAASCREQREVHAEAAPPSSLALFCGANDVSCPLHCVCLSVSRARVHTRARTYTSTHTHTHNDAYMQICTHTYTNTRTHTHTHIQIHTCNPHTGTHTHTKHVHTYTHSYTHTYTHKHTQPHEPPYTCAQTNTHTHTHTHTHIHPYSYPLARAARTHTPSLLLSELYQ